MRDLIAELKKESKDRGVKFEAEAFDLLYLTACTECCSTEKGGNKQCPPIKAAE
jgi:hypothetical protein